jgi:hypothetical protein
LSNFLTLVSSKRQAMHKEEKITVGKKCIRWGNKGLVLIENYSDSDSVFINNIPYLYRESEDNFKLFSKYGEAMDETYLKELFNQEKIISLKSNQLEILKGKLKVQKNHSTGAGVESVMNKLNLHYKIANKLDLIVSNKTMFIQIDSLNKKGSTLNVPLKEKATQILKMFGRIRDAYTPSIRECFNNLKKEIIDESISFGEFVASSSSELETSSAKDKFGSISLSESITEEEKSNPKLAKVQTSVVGHSATKEIALHPQHGLHNFCKFREINSGLQDLNLILNKKWCGYICLIPLLLEDMNYVDLGDLLIRLKKALIDKYPQLLYKGNFKKISALEVLQIIEKEGITPRIAYCIDNKIIDISQLKNPTFKDPKLVIYSGHMEWQYSLDEELVLGNGCDPQLIDSTLKGIRQLFGT